MILYIDIETIPSYSEDVAAYIAKTIVPPGTLSKAESIAKWHLESKADAVADAVAKTGLDGAFGSVVCIGYQMDDAPANVIYGLNEFQLLKEFNEVLQYVPHDEWFTTVVVGHNVCNFDLRFLLQRHMVNDIQPHIIIHRAAAAKPWETAKVYDTMVQWSGLQKGIKLDRLAFALGVPGKGDIDGSMVAGMVKDGRLEEVADYCRTDVEMTRLVHRRMTWK